MVNTETLRDDINSEENSPVQVFKLDKSFLRLWKVSFYFTLFLILAVVVGVFFYGINRFSPPDLMALVTFIIILIIFAVQAGSALGRVDSSDIALDDEGIWYRHLTKDAGLIMWARIARIDEQVALQCLNLLDNNGKILLRAEYQLKNFENFRKILLENVSSYEDKTLPNIFAKSFSHHLQYILFAIGIFTSVAFSVQSKSPTFLNICILFIMAAILYEYLTTVYKIEIEERGLNIYFPGEKKFIDFTEISDLKLSDRFFRGTRLPEIQLTISKNKELIKFKDVGENTNLLFVVLKQSMEKNGFSDKISYITASENEEDQENYYQ